MTSDARDNLIQAAEACGLSTLQINEIFENWSRGIRFDPVLGIFAEKSISRFAHAGDADDCGHERPGNKGGKFTEGNTCAEGGGSSEEAKEKKYHNFSEGLDDPIMEVRQATRRELRGFHEQAAEENIKKLDDNEKKSINSYVHKYYQEINDIARHGRGSWGKPVFDKEGNEINLADQAERNIKIMERALSKTKIGNDMVLYRSVGNISGLIHKFDIKNPDSFIGARITDNGFMSTTLSNEVAIRDFGNQPDAALFEIDADADTEGTSLGTMGRTGESEVLLNRGHTIEITGHRLEDRKNKYGDVDRKLILKARIVKGGRNSDE